MSSSNSRNISGPSQESRVVPKPTGSNSKICH